MAGRPKRVFTPTEIETIVNLYKEGKNTNAIAKELHCSPNTISQCLKDNGVDTTLAKRGPKAIEMPLSTRLNKYGHINEFVDMYRMGSVYTLQDIADRFFTNVDEVRSFAKRLGLKRFTLPSAAKAKKIDKSDGEQIVCRRLEDCKPLPKDLRMAIDRDNDILSEELKSAFIKSKHLRHYIMSGESSIKANSEVGGVMFDIVIPSEKTIIVNTKTAKGKEQWKKRLGMNGFEFTNWLLKNHYKDILFTHEGINKIVTYMDEHRAAMEERRILSISSKETPRNPDIPDATMNKEQASSYVMSLLEKSSNEYEMDETNE